ncbi:MAG: MATE family efflux transporter [Oscillospiraceae bacterium]|nr:MATE family efflux transporter [Oscillospiraceae bacterium]
MKNADMTGGGIVPMMIRFAIPLFIGNLLQQLYNAFDAIVVGNYVSSDALAAVGASGPFINMIIAFFMGMSMGASVLISQAFGAHDAEDMRGLIHTAVSLAIALGVALSLVGVAITPAVLRVMRTPEEIIPDAVVYLRIYFCGLSALTVYNIGAAILTAIGDTRRPLYFLIISSILHILINLLAVIVFKMGIAGVGFSTVFSQLVTAVLVIVTLCRAVGPHRLELRSLRINWAYTRRIFRIGLPGGIQTSIISASNIIVQSYINLLGAQAVAGYSATTRLDAFIMLPVQTMSMTVATFVGQNLGAGNVKRARQGVKIAVTGGLMLTAALSVVTLANGRTFLRIFTPEADILEYGLRFLRVFAPLYIILNFSQIIPGALRGSGDVKMAMFTCVGSFVGLRQLYLFVMTKFIYTPESVALAYPLTWAVAGAILTVYYLKSDWRRFEKGG